MAVRVVNVNDTIETLRSTFNSHATDTGDLTNLDTTDKSSLVAAVNEAKAGTSQFTEAVATGTAKALAGQLSPQEALDEVAAEWAKIVKRVGADNVREAYSAGVALEDNLKHTH